MSNTNINSKDYRNRGVDVLLNGGKQKNNYPFHIIFEKLITILNREFTFYFEFSLKFRKKKQVSTEKKNVSN